MESNRKNIFTESIFLAVIPFLGYLTVFIYELGFATYFNMPHELIQPSFTSVCLVTAFIVGALLLVFVGGHLFSVTFLMAFPLRDGPLLRAVKRVIPVLLITLFFICLLGREWKLYFGLLVISSVIILINFLWPLVTCRNEKSYAGKLKKQEEIEEKFDPEFRRFFDYVDSKFSRQIVSIFLIIAFFLLLVYQTGFIKARQKEYFWQLNGGQKIVVRIYGDNLICVGFDAEKDAVDGEFDIIKISPKISLKMIKTGRLKSFAMTAITKR